MNSTKQLANQKQGISKITLSKKARKQNQKNLFISIVKCAVYRLLSVYCKL